MAKKLNLTGQRFGKLLVLEPGENAGTRTTWHCKCDCGNEITVETQALRNAGKESCGCWSRVSIDYTGKRVGDLSILERIPNIGRCSAWRCRCGCGEELILKNSEMKDYRKCPHVHYPESLYAAVFNISLSAIRYAWIKPSDWEAGFDHALSDLTERERTILLMRFKEDRTLMQCAREFSITSERARQIEVKALRKLRNPKRARYIRYGYNEAERQDEEKRLCIEAARKKEEELQRQREELQKKQEEEAKRLKAERLRDSGCTPVEQLNLSIRSANALRRSGILTLADLMQIEEEELRSVHGVGDHSFREITRVLRTGCPASPQ